MAIQCPECGRRLEATASFCDMCGSPLRSESDAEAICPGCQAPVPAGHAFCNNCGTAVEQDVAGGLATGGEQPTIVESEPASPAAVRICPGCGHKLPAEATFCNMCGTQLGADTPGSRHQTQAYGDATPAASPTTPARPDPDPRPSALPARLVLQGSNATLSLLPDQQELIVGREDPAGELFPALDLGPYGGDEGGVSRRHARITREGEQYYLEDLKSTNHTFVNRKKLAPGQRHLLTDGDRVRFGAIVATFHAAGG